MIKSKSLVLYKKQPAAVTETGEKYTIEFCTAPATPTGKKAQYATQKVRDKDIILLHEGPISSLEAVLTAAENVAVAEEMDAKLIEAWELLVSDDSTATEPISVKDLAELSLGSFSADSSWAFYKKLSSHTHFAENIDGDPLMFVPRTEDEISALKKKLYEKEHEADIRAALIARLKEKKLDLPGDAKYMQEVEALALGQTDKSKLMKEAGFKETPEKAHKLLLDTGIWTIFKNPHPSRRGLSMQSATEHLPHPPENEERLELDCTAWAIDNAWSTDPDDAISYDGTYLWVHIADPASTVTPDSKIDITARNRGSTLYIPEGAARMLSEESLEDYALGLCEYKDGKPTGKKSKALSFRLRLDENGAITDSAVIKTLVHVERLTYEQADERRDTPELAPLFEIADRNLKRRTASGAVSIELPEVHISLTGQEVTITPTEKPLASGMIREMMLLAGEAAAKFAFKNGIPFPFVSQEKPDIPKDIPAGLAGQYRLRRSMRSRSVGVTPSQHAGLGLGMYSQVTSPLRRYSDLIAHIQLRAFLDGRDLLDKDTMLERISAGDAAAGNASKAERESNMHWTLVYLRQHPNWTGKGIAVEIRGKQAVFLIPELAQETLITPRKVPELNDTVTLKAGNINIPELSVTFQEV
ncbi:MAG: RNB domain-containing ribonuclease [Treponemataceae bacterium]|nr:RNB domain-containing ribonuclease [Treponemataceae bacterium]